MLRPARSLLALTASALALPGVCPPVRADAAPTTSTVAWRYTHYAEDNLAMRPLAGSPRRYDIDIHQVNLLVPVGERHSLGITSSYESMGGASPWYTVAGADGAPAVVMSGATITEQRRDFTLTGRRYLDNGTLGLTAGGSHENDYDSLSIGMDAERHFHDNLTTVAGGFSVARDELDPTDAALFNRIASADKRGTSVFVSVSRILDSQTLVQTGLSTTRLSGYLSDPYKLGDRRPDSRTQWAWSTSWRRFIETADAALHADYRYYHDSFGISSHAVELAWYQNLGRRLQVVPGVRWYSQGAADFFTETNDFTGTQPSSSDYRLSAFGAWSGSLRVQYVINRITVVLSGERYEADASHGAHAGPASPALVSYTRWSLGLGTSF